MAKDMLEAVYLAEEECKTREANAKQLAQEKTKDTKQAVEKIIKDAESNANKEAEALFQYAKSEGLEHLNKVKAVSEKECEQVSSIAQKNRKNVIKSVVKLITDQ